MKEVTEKAQEAYKQAMRSNDKNTCKLLDGIFGADTFRPKDVKDRIKTFEDAINELGEGHKFVVDYTALKGSTLSNDVIAYLKLRIISAALNEGWEPQFTEDEYRYFPWFCLYTNREIEQMPQDRRKGVCLWGGSAYNGTRCGLGGSYSTYDFSVSSTCCGARLTLKTRELAIYSGKQFIDIWKDFVVL